jgi:SDR family mycofactocin-dependent oxidoreductase
VTGRVEGKVAFVTGAARGQGRSHAIRLAQEGADIIAIDLAGPIGTVPYPLATPQDLAQTVKEVEALDRRIIATQADVRDYAAVKAALDDGVAQLGRLDIVSANAGILSFGTVADLEDEAWQDVLDVNLTGVWHAAKAAIPHLRAAGGGSIILTSSAAALRAQQHIGHYVAAKHGVVGLMRTLALELGPGMIRVNTVHPTVVNTDMAHNGHGRDPAGRRGKLAALTGATSRRLSRWKNEGRNPPSPGSGSRPGLRLGRITPHGVQARAIRHVGRPVEPLVAQALVKPCAIAIAGLQISGQALAV